MTAGVSERAPDTDSADAVQLVGVVETLRLERARLDRAIAVAMGLDAVDDILDARRFHTGRSQVAGGENGRSHVMRVASSVLDRDVVEQRGDDRLVIEAHLREDLRDLQGVVDVGLAGCPALPLVGVGAELECAANPLDLGRLEVLAGQTANTAPALSLVTQFGGGKTHTLTSLYHIVKAGPDAARFTGVADLIASAGISTAPSAMFPATSSRTASMPRGGAGSPSSKNRLNASIALGTMSSKLSAAE